MIKKLIYDRANRKMRLINIFLNSANIFERNIKPKKKTKIILIQITPIKNSRISD